MTLTEFRDSLSAAAPPDIADGALRGLWWAGKGDWNRAHECAQQGEGQPDFDLVHAHLHRQEGDPANAGYWYRRAGEAVPTASIEAEWTMIATRAPGAPMTRRQPERAMVAGRCLCGAVAIEIGAPARWAWHDHTRASRIAHGAAYATYIGSWRSRFRVAEGEEHVARYEDAATRTARGFCRRCGTPLFYERAHSPQMVNVPRALFAGSYRA